MGSPKSSSSHCGVHRLAFEELVKIGGNTEHSVYVSETGHKEGQISNEQMSQGEK